MGGEVQNDSKAIQKHGADVKATIVPQIEKARTTLNGINLEGGDFSITGTAASMAYPGALQFAFETLKTHEDQINTLGDQVHTAGKAWRAADDASKTKYV